MEILLLVLVLGVVWYVVRSRSGASLGPGGSGRPPRTVRAADLAAARRTAQEDVTRFGEELQRLDGDVAMSSTDEAMLQDWQRALDSYESASRSLELLGDPDGIRHVTSALEDGRYAVACVRARREGRPLPTRRPPCFFNPAHGPSSVDVEWAPPGGQQRQIPVCPADADRLAQGAEPDVRTVPQGAGRVPYWQAGPAYSPWASGYFGAYAAGGLLPGFLVGTLLASSWDGTPADGFDTGDAGGGGDAADASGDAGGDSGGDWGGGDGGGWGGDSGFDFGGDFGGF